MTIQSIGCTLQLREVYDGVTIPAETLLPSAAEDAETSSTRLALSIFSDMALRFLDKSSANFAAPPATLAIIVGKFLAVAKKLQLL